MMTVCIHKYSFSHRISRTSGFENCRLSTVEKFVTPGTKTQRKNASSLTFLLFFRFRNPQESFSVSRSVIP